MEIQYYGGNCLKITTKKASVVVDDNLASLGAKSVTKEGDIALFTGQHQATNPKVRLLVDQPGEYEVADVSIRGVAARAHIDEEGSRNATIYKVEAEDIRLAVVGHIDSGITESQLEALGTVDILFIPVGGNGFTLDPVGALKVIKEIEPKVIVPTQYAVPGLKYEVPAQELEEAIKVLAMEPKERVPKLKLKGADGFTDQAQLIILERQ